MQFSFVVFAHFTVVVVYMEVVEVTVFVVVVIGRPGVRCPRVVQVQGMWSPVAAFTAGVQSTKQLAQ
jgi:hypothetical protein